jgi:hypothetical protein
VEEERRLSCPGARYDPMAAPSNKPRSANSWIAKIASRFGKALNRTFPVHATSNGLGEYCSGVLPRQLSVIDPKRSQRGDQSKDVGMLVASVLTAPSRAIRINWVLKYVSESRTLVYR